MVDLFEMLINLFTGKFNNLLVHNQKDPVHYTLEFLKAAEGIKNNVWASS